ncbi:hypothetical protein [Enterobacter phage 03_vB_Eclo_IJM]|nr:hypothetical protein [Enterobacter phage 03_vB_Eclo_IJM]
MRLTLRLRTPRKGSVLVSEDLASLVLPVAVSGSKEVTYG